MYKESAANTEIVTIEPVATIPARIERQSAPMLFAGTRKAEKPFWEFFTANIRNPNTRMAYLTATYRFADWCEVKHVALEQIEPMVVAAYVEQLTKTYAPATVNQHLTAIRKLFDWLVIGQLVLFNPASSVRGPKHVVRTGKTPVLTAAETRALLDAIDITVLVGLRDRVLIGLIMYSFACVSAAVSMTVADYYTQGKRSFFFAFTKKAASTWSCRWTTRSTTACMRSYHSMGLSAFISDYCCAANGLGST